MGYITPVATLVKWFPDRRGLMTGVAVAGYGAGALVMSPIAARTVASYGVPVTFLGLGIVYLVLVVAAAQFYANPPAGWTLAGWEPKTAVAKAATKVDFSVSEAMRTWQFWLLWVMLFLNVSAGIMIISQASPMAQQMVGMSAVAAAGMVGLISIFNGAGRVFWAWVSDMIGRANVYFLLYAIQAVIFFSLPSIHNLTAVQHLLRHHRAVLWRRLRHHAVVHGRLLRAEVHGRHLWMDPAGVGCGGDSLADFDCAPASGNRSLWPRSASAGNRAGLLVGAADLGALPSAQGRTGPAEVRVAAHGVARVARMRVEQAEGRFQLSALSYGNRS